jgi:hypothetical protein
VQSNLNWSKLQSGTTTSGSTTYTLGAAGQLNSASITDGRSRTVTFTNDMNGQALRRDEADANYSTGDPHEVWYRFAGREMGYTGNNGTLDTNYAGSITNRTKAPPTGTPGPFRFGATTATAYQDFDPSLDPINSYSQGSSGGSYTVREGDTLAGIAGRLWGDSSLWYKIAEANGMSAASGLIPGQNLTIPIGVNKSSHNASTFKVYDPSEAMGDTSPTAPKPQKGNKCGAFGAIVLIAIAVAVAAIAAPAIVGGAAVFANGTMVSAATGLTAAFGGTAAAAGSMAAIGAGIVGGAMAGAAGSIVSQGLGLATGLQDKFSWKAVGMAALGGGVGGGIGKLGGSLGKFLNADKLLSNAARGAVSSTLTHGIGVATGLQKKFDFAGVAAAGIGAAALGEMGRRLGISPSNTGVARNALYYGNQTVAGMAGAISNAAARTLINGSDFGDNILAALPDVIGTTIGNIIADPVVAKIEAAREREAGSKASDRPDGRARNLAAIGARVMFGEMNDELDNMWIEFDRTTSLDWEGSPAQAAHTRIKQALHAQIMSALTGGNPVPSPQEVAGLRDNSRLAPMPTTPHLPTTSHTVLDAWIADYNYAWDHSGGKYDPYNDALARKGFAANREYIAWLDGVADAQLGRDMRDFGTEYWKISSMVIAPLGAVDTAYRILNGEMTASEAAIALVTMGKGRVLRASDSIATSASRLRAISAGASDLSPRNASVLAQLEGYGSRAVIPKKGFGQSDLAALSAATGDEFAMFTTGGRRLLVRGNAGGVPISLADGSAQSLANQGWRWSSHMHPDGSLLSSAGDRAVLSVFRNSRSSIMTPTGSRGLFNANGDLIGPGWLPGGR